MSLSIPSQTLKDWNILLSIIQIFDLIKLTSLKAVNNLMRKFTQDG